MKTSVCIVLVLLGVRVSAQVLLNDQFTGSSLNSSNWTDSIPYADSSAIVSSGDLSLTNGAGVLSTAGYSGPIEVDFSFAFTGNDHDSFRVYTRADHFYPDGYAIEHGVGVSFRIQEDTGNTNGNIMLEDSTGTIASGTYSLTTGTFYSVRLIDTGTELEMFWDDDLTPFLTANTSDAFGDLVGAFNRQGAASGSSISAGSVSALDYLTVTAIPEPSVYAAVLGALALAIAGKRKRAG